NRIADKNGISKDTYSINVLFFFSSRRRHTRWPRDWSSDVCSSDLLLTPVATFVARTLASGTTAFCVSKTVPTMLPSMVWPKVHRSEERRVGKECRVRMWAWEYRKKGIS